MNNATGKPTLVLGASENPARYSNMAVRLLQAYRHPVMALGLRKGKIDGVDIETEASAFKDSPIDTITLYLNPKNQIPYYETILSLNPKRVIFNPGTENPEFEDLLVKNGIETEEACTLVLLRTSQY